eukprot:TRINITY_DN14939_c0_g1_i1.p1 TRINITY_DN14939_c0_g1~~TRINITY_DN14939_c0_g1_i1.p1  ORF type:complete len:941 (+),score=144.17 TRINITY_DN14939_c0_g1_i1:751-3573(+)
MRQVVVTRLQDADLHLREACAETVFRLARALVTPDLDNAQAFATLLKPLFGALGEHSKWVQIGAASCICSVIQGSPSAVIRENLMRLCSRLVQHLGLPLAMARPQLLSACVFAMQAVDGADFDDVLPSLMPCLESCLGAASDWQTRKQAIEVLQAIGDNPELGQSLELQLLAPGSAGPTPLQRRISQLLESIKTDKVRAVREAVKEVNARWCIGKPSVSASFPAASGRSSSPSAAPAWAAEREREPSTVRIQGRRSPSPTAAVQQQHSGGAGNVSYGAASVSSSASMGTSQQVDRPQVRRSFEARSVAPGREREPSGACADDYAMPRGSVFVDTNDAAAEKAARRTAVKEALSGAVLNSTKKPKAATRKSIFNGPANAGFFKSAAISTSTPPTSACGAEEPSGDAEFEDGQELLYQEENEAAFEGEPGMSPLPSGANSPCVAGAPSSRTHGHTRSEHNTRYQNDDNDADVRPDPTTNPSAMITSHRHADGFEEAEAYEAPRDDLDEDAEPVFPVAWMANNGAAAPPNDEGVDTDRQRSNDPRLRRTPVPHYGDTPTLRLEALFEEKIRALEEARLESEERLAGRVRCLERVGEDQRGQINSLQQQLEIQEQRLQAQRQQLSIQEQCIQDLEARLTSQEEQLEQQAIQLSNNKVLLEEHRGIQQKQDQSLQDHQQQIEEQADRLALQQSQLDALSSRPPATARAIDEDGGRHIVASSSKPLRQSGRQEAFDADAPASPSPSVLVNGSGGRGIAETRTEGSSSAAAMRLAPVPLLVGTTGTHDLTYRDSVSSLASMGLGQPSGAQRKSTALWERVIEFCEADRYLDAYKQVIAEPEEVCLLRLMQHTGPIVERLDAESNSRLIRRLIHILSSPAKEPATGSIEQIFAWLWQALEVGIHFTSSQVEDLVSALDKVAAPLSPLPATERAEASRLLSRVSALRRT